MNGKEHGEVRLSTFCETRWYASLFCRTKQPGTHWPKSSKVLLHTSFFLMRSESNEEPALAPELKVVMQDRQLYTDVALFVQVIDPFISAIATLEFDSSTCGDVLIEMLRIRMTCKRTDKEIARLSSLFNLPWMCWMSVLVILTLTSTLLPRI